MLAVLLLAGCAGSSEPAAAPSSAAPSTSSSIPSPNAAQTVQLLAALRKVDAGLDDERSIGRARNVCLDIRGGVDSATLTANAVARFEGGSAPSLSPADGRAIVAAVRSSFCT